MNSELPREAHWMLGSALKAHADLLIFHYSRLWFEILHDQSFISEDRLTQILILCKND